MMPPSSKDVAAPREFVVWNGRSGLAWAAAAVSCVMLLGVVRYCATYGAGKATLFDLFLGSFRADMSRWIIGSADQGSLSGEATASEWNYCAFVPLIVAFIVWQLWPRLRRTPVHGEAAGYWIFGAGLLVYLAGFRMENYYIGMASLELIYAGLIVLFLGREIMRVLLFPWAFLMFMWPYNFMEDVALQLRLVMSALSHRVLEWMGVANVLDGSAVLSLPGASHPFAIDIADPCSGIRSLFSLVMVTSVLAFFLFRRFWKQALLVALAPPLVVLGNLVRILVLTLATIHYGNAFAIGSETHPSWVHEGAGYLVYLIDLGGIIAVGIFLARGRRVRGHAHA